MALRIRFQYPTGYQLGYSIERLSDGLLLDFNDSTFKANPTTLINPIAEDTGSFVGRYKTTLTPTPTSQFEDGHYCVTIHDLKANNVVAELAATMTGGDDIPSFDLFREALQQILAAEQAPKALTLTSIFPAH